MRNTRISDRNDIEYLYRCDKIAYDSDQNVFYDPKYNSYHHAHGDAFNPHEVFNTTWFKQARFKYDCGDPCYLPEQDPSRKPSRRKVRQRRLGDRNITNFIELGTMSTCNKTDFNGADAPVTSWQSQKECNFAIKSVVENRCMHWDRNLYGHCDCILAYQHATGNDIDLTKTQEIRRIDEIKDLPPDHHFEESRQITVNELGDLYNSIDPKVTILKKTHHSNANVFYYKDWDTFFDGHGKFLENMTTKRREKDLDPQEVADKWSGDLSMSKEDDKTFVSIPVDNSGKFYDSEMNDILQDVLRTHQFYHTIEKVRPQSDKNPTIWPICDNEDAASVLERCYFNDPKPAGLLLDCPKIVSVESVSRKGAKFIIDTKLDASPNSCCLECCVSMCSNNT